MSCQPARPVGIYNPDSNLVLTTGSGTEVLFGRRSKNETISARVSGLMRSATGVTPGIDAIIGVSTGLMCPPVSKRPGTLVADPNSCARCMGEVVVMPIFRGERLNSVLRNA